MQAIRLGHLSPRPRPDWRVGQEGTSGEALDGLDGWPQLGEPGGAW